MNPLYLTTSNSFWKNLNVAFENENFLIVDKPPLFLTIPGRDEKAASPRPCLQQILESHYKYKLFIVHRLDFEVSGVLVFAKNAHSHKVASQWFENRMLQKKYEAWTEKKNEAELPSAGQTQNWTSQLLRGKKRAYESPHGKPSQTHAVFLETSNWNGCSLLRWQLFPVTGRSHQLRFELFKRGFPILGDTLYGAAENLNLTGIALRAVCIDFSKISEVQRLGLPTVITVPALGAVYA